jgi:hypothetical protein
MSIFYRVVMPLPKLLSRGRIFSVSYDPCNTAVDGGAVAEKFFYYKGKTHNFYVIIILYFVIVHIF